MKNHCVEEKLGKEIRNYPQPCYPFPDLINPLADELFQVSNQWIDTDSLYTSEEACEKHKRHRLTDTVARSFPWLCLDEMRPVARFAVFFAILDDYLDKATGKTISDVGAKVSAILTGQDVAIAGHGVYHHCLMIRKEALACSMPRHLYIEFVDSSLQMLASYGEEKQYNAGGSPPPLTILQSIRSRSSGGVPFAKYLCMQKNYRHLPIQFL
ncbi:hypothetical protein CDD80_4355 [Ophiocordyceps camponoti-rufipedis]|uniref:Uncharacterized protein n=1 Tax=Ophiocordyceps camponoti-rufipedis TaxID=2004952 RepID=A0A2C5ZI99_9HYPO|nr:hypothetical protein CDD80_4355 [Ophiocordyceps camponoti-rufipedis]